MINVRHLVSKKKRRYQEDGFDLDLAYIKPNIVAMGYPSESIEGYYRNPIDSVVECSEKKDYDESKFHNRVAHFGFDDHNAPPFKLMEPCCKDIDDWVSQGENYAAIIHCKAGKGRTGVMICAYLMYIKMFQDANKAMEHYADARTHNKKGVTIPSQRRYIVYFGYFTRHCSGPNANQPYLPSTVLLNSITFVGTPTYNSGTCSPMFVIYQTKVVLLKSKAYEIRRNEEGKTTLTLDKPIPMCGDIKMDFFHKERFKKERMFVFWFNTFFLEHGVTLNHPDGGGTNTTGTCDNGDEYRTYTLHQHELDKANKDKKHKFFPKGFRVEINFTVPASIDNGTDGCRTARGSSSSTYHTPQQTHSLPKYTITHSQSGDCMSDELKTMSLKTSTLSPTRGNAKGPSPLADKKLQPSRSMPIPQNNSEASLTGGFISKSDDDLAKEPLSDDDDDDEMVF